MDFIILDDCTTDNILTCEQNDVDSANDYLAKMAAGFGLSENEVKIPCGDTVKRLGIMKAYQIRALAMVGSDTTVMMDGRRSEDIYLQKYNLYTNAIKEMTAGIDYSDFAVDGTSGSGKGGIGIIHLSRA